MFQLTLTAIFNPIQVFPSCVPVKAQSQVGFIFTFSYSLSSISSILELGFQSIHHLQMTSSEGFQQHFSIISNFRRGHVSCLSSHSHSHSAFAMFILQLWTELELPSLLICIMTMTVTMTMTKNKIQNWSFSLLWFLHEKQCSFYTHLFCCTKMR